ncbi:dTDP-4-dehydrorhamnose reductase [Flavobacterium ponti]|uniref:dTDP-4-dehydrorhamnose reductase n=1 Tax=Flavobacterium ponti TaxID=665133 RepID=A0ABV9P268_9FLAO
MVVLVTGASGQLGQAIESIAEKFPDIEFEFCDSEKLDITDYDNVNAVFNEFIPKYCINAAAYTAVDKAESEPDKAYSINVLGAQNLAKICKMNGTILLHVSTDFVFDGTKKTPYTELDEPNPTGVYGQTKLDGEEAIKELWEKHFIIRTSWVYSQFGNNFMKTMLRLGAEREELSVVNDQIGTPTNAVDLAEALIKIVESCHAELVSASNYGIYNFSNEGECSWYDFAKKIFEINNITIDLHPIPTKDYPTPAKRPAYSVLDKSKIKIVFGIEINNWADRVIS